LLELNRSEDRPESHNLGALLDATKTTELEEGQTRVVSVSTFIPDSRSLQERGIVEENTFYSAFSGVINAVKYLNGHGLYHRDLTPKNILITSKGKGVVVDMALAKRKDEEAEEGQLPTTLGHLMSDPRMHESGTKYDAQAEVYALGANMYYALTGKLAKPVTSKEKLREVLKKVPRKQRSLIERCLTTNLERRFKDVNELEAEFDKNKQRKSFTQSLKRLIRKPLNIATGLLLATVATIGGIKVDEYYGRNLEQVVEEANKPTVFVDWNGEGASAGNNLVEMKVRYGYRSTREGENHKIGMYPNEIPFIEAMAGDNLNFSISLRDAAGVKSKRGINSPCTPTLEGRIYIEGGKEVKKFTATPGTFNNAVEIDMASYDYGGASVSINVPNEEEIGTGVRNVAIEIMAPEDTAESRNNNIASINWNGDGRVISREVVPVYISGKTEETEKNGQPMFSSLTLGDYSGERIAFKEINEKFPWGSNIRTGFKFHYYVPELDRTMPPEDLLNENGENYYNIQIPNTPKETTATVIYSVWDENGDLRTFGGVPVTRRFRYKQTENRDFYGWDIGNDGKELPLILRREYEFLSKAKLNPKVKKEEEMDKESK
jgi:hypothetical protein